MPTVVVLSLDELGGRSSTSVPIHKRMARKWPFKVCMDRSVELRQCKSGGKIW